MDSKLPILFFLLFTAIIFLGATFHAERKRARSEEIKRIVQDAEKSLDQTRLVTQQKNAI